MEKDTMDRDYTVGQLAREAGIAVGTVRHYERIGLLPPARRSAGNQRLFGEDARRRLGFLRHTRELGFSLDAARELLELADHPERSCGRADAIARQHLTEVERRIARLEGLRRELARMVAACGEGPVAACQVMETLADHGRCQGDHGGLGKRDGLRAR